jgi:DNA adenine methylase
MTPSRPALRYHGAKWNLAPWVISHFPPHESYVEPFGGSAAVLLQKTRSALETYNDLDGEVVTFFQVLREQTEALVRLIELTPWARAEYALSYEPTDDPLERARRFFVHAWMSIGGTSRQSAWTSGWRYIKTVNARWKGPAETWCMLDHLYDVANRLKGVQFECRDALEILPRYDGARTLFYCDPPYVFSTRSGHAGRMYAHEFQDEQHVRLAEVLGDLQGMVVLSGYPSGLYAELYEQRDWVRVNTEAKVNGGRGDGKRIESLWLNAGAVAALSGQLFSPVMERSDACTTE